jgi:DNA-binding transcriptional ArsR family regulator
MDTFAALAEPTRRSIIEIISSRGEMSATDICDRFNISHPAISQHLKILREAQLVQVQKRAQQRIYRLNPTKMMEVERWAKQVAQDWNQRFDALDLLLEAQKNKNAKKR